MTIFLNDLNRGIAGIYAIKRGEANLFTQNVAQIFSDNSELSVERLASLNTVAKSFLCVEWWGTF